MSPDPPQKAPWWWSHDPAARLMVRSGLRSPESGAPPQFPQIIYSDWGQNFSTRVLSYSAECNYWPAILIRDKLVPNQFLTIIQNILLTTFWDVFCWRFRNASITKPMSRTFGQRPQQDLHDNKTNCSVGRGIQTYFSIYTALHALTVILAKK